ncbi:preprotein translocase subunit SecA [Pseudomaricurvus alcaniphilus]|uniref:preprotein translocase subunit SecA n=1 Tax=Pseudomaricurvus alcaniphilus TaxID=1166482 RepID=UPI001409F0CA|nr:preprotein translocase subunit SecA [Pseudomaricurvus alcaniphilus]NHN39533.1 preprotein translocase subunit SecA [Pseudomaricurvus alcaniphilus]
MITSACHAPADYRHRPERPPPESGWLQRLSTQAKGKLELNRWRLRRRQRRFLRLVTEHSRGCEAETEQQLLQRVRELAAALRQQGLQDPLVAEVFAIIRELSGRTLGMRHFDSQLLGGWVMLQGRVAEMKTGEGKTLTAALPVITAALAGMPVHVVTVNDYLTQRDAEEMAPLYQCFGFCAGLIIHATTPAQRRQAYQADIVYVTGKELVFDYLRDQMKLPQVQPLRLHVEALKSPRFESALQLRGLHFALVDEADSVLIDESRTPLIISANRGNEDQQQFIEEAFELSLELQEGLDFSHDVQRREIELTEQGTRTIRELSEGLGPLWRGAIRREEIVHKALLGRYIYQRDKDYLVRDGKVELIDPLTGRVMEGRSWEKGLHQMVELKEGCELTRQRVTEARISYQNFFRRYLCLCGMTGTAWEVRQEFWDTYGLAVTRVPTHKPERRRIDPPRVFLTDAERWQALVRRCQELLVQNRAVLIGTGSVASSEEASDYLRRAGIEHQVLNAKQDQAEAELVAQAGQPGRVMVATNMAGRGTDIKLAPLVREAGGLHVILTDRYESGRVDRQLAGRCARQGDPGSFEMLLSLENAPARTLRGKSLLASSRSLGLNNAAGQKMALQALQVEQQFVERQNYLARQSTLEYDLKQGDLLAFSGRGN